MITYRIDQVSNRADIGQKLGDFGCHDVEGLGVFDGGFGEHGEFEIADYILVGNGYGHGEVDDGVDKGLDKERGVAGAPEGRVFGIQAVQDGDFEVVGGGLEKGDYVVICGLLA